MYWISHFGCLYVQGFYAGFVKKVNVLDGGMPFKIATNSKYGRLFFGKSKTDSDMQVEPGC